MSLPRRTVASAPDGFEVILGAAPRTSPSAHLKRASGAPGHHFYSQGWLFDHPHPYSRSPTSVDSGATDGDRTTKPALKSLYARLRTEGLSPSFVRAKLLPDWWDDSLADNPANLAVAEVTLARNLGLTIRALRDPAQPLSLDLSGGLALKRSTTAGTKKARASVRIALTAATTLVSQLERLPAFRGRLTAEEVRKLILARARSVDFAGLLEFAWSHGIVVLPFRTHPTESSQFDGLATWISGRPVIILASRRQAPAWLAFHLAHELGHILLGHVGSEGDTITDIDLQKVDNSTQEREADRFALECLTGDARPRLKIQAGLTAESLKAVVQDIRLETGIDPGVSCLIYAYQHDCYPAAQKALRLLGRADGGHHEIDRYLAEFLPGKDCADSTSGAIDLLMGV